MKYHYREGVKKDLKKPMWLVWLALLAIVSVGAYAAANFVAPRLVSMPLSAKATPDATMAKMLATTPQPDDKHLYIPQLNVDVPIVIGADRSVLKGNAWWPSPEGDTDPERGAAIALRALQFTLGTTPWETRNLSPFYNLDKLRGGDELYVDYDGKRFAYRVKTVHQEAPTIAKIQSPDKKSTLLLYPVDEQGEIAKGVVIEAESAGVVSASKQE